MRQNVGKGRGAKRDEASDEARGALKDEVGEAGAATRNEAWTIIVSFYHSIIL